VSRTAPQGAAGSGIARGADLGGASRPPGVLDGAPYDGAPYNGAPYNGAPYDGAPYGLARASAWKRLAATTFDVLVIGGGATGAGVARDAALRGLTTALVERDDFASGTSSRSSRLIHGGVRYLEHGYFHLVFEASRERRTLMRIAPHLVRPLAFTWPVYTGARVPRWKLGAGLLLYDALALFRNVSRHRRLSAAAVRDAEPALDATGLVGGARYYDAATDDARLTLATAMAAADAGAVVLNHAAVSALTHDAGGQVTGAVVADGLDAGTRVTVLARIVVNAAGPWSDTIRRMDQPTARAGVLGTKGVHLAVPASRVGNRGAVTLLSAVDGRVMFVLPAGTQTIIGTTDTPTTTVPDEVRASLEDVDYLLASVNACFPGAALTRADVITAWAGIRPLIATEPRVLPAAAPNAPSGAHATAPATALASAPASAPASASREHAIEQGASGVVTVSGGKLTTYRSMAAETVDLVARALGRPPVASTTHALPLPGAGGLAGPGAVERAVAAAVAIVGPDRADIAARLVHAYGDRWPIVWALTQGDEALSARLVDGLPYIGAEVVYAVLAESACTLADVLVRRTHVAFETRDAGRAAARMAAALLAPRVGWDADAVARAVAAYDVEAARLFTIDA